MEIAHSVEQVLGGRATLKLLPQTGGQWHTLIEAGLPAGALESLKQATSLSDSQLASLLGVSGKTLQHARASRERLDSVTSDRIFRTARLVALAGEVLEDNERGIAWLGRSQIGLGGCVPFALMTTEAGCTQVEQLLLRIEHSVYA